VPEGPEILALASILPAVVTVKEMPGEEYEIPSQCPDDVTVSLLAGLGSTAKTSRTRANVE